MLKLINKYILCKLCNSKNIRKQGDAKTDNFGHCLQAYECEDCGHIFLLDALLSGQEIAGKWTQVPDINEEEQKLMEQAPFEVYVRIEMTSRAKNSMLTAVAEIPMVNGIYDLSIYDYPISRFQRFIVDGDKVDLDGDISVLMRTPLLTTKKYIAMDYDKSAWPEYVDIKITKEYKDSY